MSTDDTQPGTPQRPGRFLGPERDALARVEHGAVPAWRRATAGEARWPVTVGVAVAIGLQLAVPKGLGPEPRWLLPALEAAVAVGLVVANPRHIDRWSPALRIASLGLIAVISVANGWAALDLVQSLVQGSGRTRAAGPLLAAGATIWSTNVIAFSLWYWELDRGGPVARAHATREHTDFLFPQMSSPQLAPPDWEPRFFDYLYLSFTNATAFSPTDVMPLSHWAKLTMMLQSAVSLVTVALVIARSVNILG